ncbi:YjdJ family protein [Jeotgalibacillus haloalkalitolerans]|uniref:YjdJ family protein n=1 Tax=Jeotgalibacillus haloalkalitolerans TaxID=3104292 RepID=A0ABU5KQ13_9BACL|nr:YjdJ family protein [Jeotgalibacillus sp. HH7-29]MDZ5713332.1 YjdJ family protein [Jeotgalibacillus sp. HH7-29]
MKGFSTHLSVAITFLAVAAAGTWYEGSAIIDDPWEWAYSTPFSQLLNGEVLHAGQISQLDHFVYAAKFQPLLPIVMMISVLYIVLLIAYRTFRTDLKRWMMLLSLTAGMFIVAGVAIANSPTAGGNAFFYFFMGAGGLSLAGVIMCCYLLNRLKTKAAIS